MLVLRICFNLFIYLHYFSVKPSYDIINSKVLPMNFYSSEYKGIIDLFGFYDHFRSNLTLFVCHLVALKQT